MGAAADWERRIEAAHARIAGRVVETPVARAPRIAPDFGGRLAVKLEQRQRTGSFKVRGAASRLSVMTPDEAAAGVTTSSMGNHGLGLAWAAREAGARAEVYVSPQVSPERVRKIRALGAEVKRVEGSVLEAELVAREEAERSRKVYVSPYNDPEVVAGQGTLGVELLRQLPDLEAVFLAVGGGGLVGGVGAYLKARDPGIQVYGCWPENAPALYESLLAGRIVEVQERPTLSESTAGGIEPGSITFELARTVVDHRVLVSEPEILAAMRRAYRTYGWVVEGSAGVALAAFLRHAEALSGRTACVVLCGGNVSPDIRTLVVGT